MKLMIFVVLSMSIFLPVNAQNIAIGDLLQQFKTAGFSLIYSTTLVDDLESIEWDGQLSIRSLRRSLASKQLALEQVDKGLWSIKLQSPTTQSASKAGRQTGTPAHLSIDNIIVTASRYEVHGGEGSSLHSITESQLQNTPSFAGDSLRVIHRLPGAASIGVSSKPNVRGGAENELLVLFDGVELIEPFHLRDFQSMFSSLNPQTIQNIEYFTGGFPAQYGNKLSGVLDIATQDTFAATGGELGISIFSTSALLFTEQGPNRFLFSARRGNLDQLLNVVNPELGKPKYHDIYGRYVRQLKQGQLKLTLFSFSDDIEFNSDEAHATSVVDNRYIWLEWESDQGDSLYMRTFLVFGDIDSKRFGQNFAEDHSEGFLLDNQSLQTFSLKHIQQLKIHEDLRFDYGFTVQSQRMEYDTTISVERGIIAEFLGNTTEIDETFRQKFDGQSISGFFTGKFRPLTDFTVQLGLRYDRQDYAASGAQSQVSPRISFVYEPFEDWQFRFSYGRFYQPQGIYELETTDLETRFFDPQKSDHWIVATEFRPGNNARFTAELFYKRIDDLKPRYENLFNPYTFSPELEPDRITIFAEEAFTRGVELSYVGNKGDFTWNLNYTYSQVQDKEDNRWIDRRWDQTHNINIIANWTRGNWNVSTAAAWHTGWTFTKLPPEIPADEPLIVSSIRSNSRLKDYATVDAKVSYHLPLSKSELSFFLEVTNLVNRTNEGGVDYEIELEDDVYQLLETDLEPIFPLVTNIGIIWRF